MLTAPAVTQLVPTARACGDAVGLWVPGGPPGDAAGPSMASLSPGMETSILAWSQAVLLSCVHSKPHLPWEHPPVQAAALCSDITQHGRVLGKKSRQWVPQHPQGSPGSDAVALPYLFSPACCQLHPTLPASKSLPWAPPNCCHPPPFLGDQGLHLPPFPVTGISDGTLQLFQAWKLAPAGAAD